MFFPQEPRLKGGGPNVAPPPPHLAPLSPAASLPPCTPGAKRCPGTAPRGRGSHLGARSILPGLGGGVVPPPPIQPHTGVQCYPPPDPTVPIYGCSWGPPPIKGSASRGCGAGTGGRMGGPCPAPPLPARPRGGAERGREAPVEEHLLVSAALGAAWGSPGPGPDVACGVRGGGAATKSPAGASRGPPPQPPSVQRRSSPGRGGGGPGVSTI